MHAALHDSTASVVALTILHAFGGVDCRAIYTGREVESVAGTELRSGRCMQTHCKNAGNGYRPSEGYGLSPVV